MANTFAGCPRHRRSRRTCDGNAPCSRCTNIHFPYLPYNRRGPACIPCRRSKIKCEGNEDHPCLSCTRKGLSCARPPPSSNGDSMTVAASPHANSKIENLPAEKLKQEEERNVETLVHMLIPKALIENLASNTKLPKSNNSKVCRRWSVVPGAIESVHA